MASIKTEDITLGYTCPECETEASQPLADIVSVGTLVCNNCDTEMELDTTHDVVPSISYDECKEHGEHIFESDHRRQECPTEH